jgi:hypothetical protein
MCKYVNRVGSVEFCTPVYPLLIRSTLLPHLRSVSSSSSIPPSLSSHSPTCDIPVGERRARGGPPPGERSSPALPRPKSVSVFHELDFVVVMVRFSATNGIDLYFR